MEYQNPDQQFLRVTRINAIRRRLLLQAASAEASVVLAIIAFLWWDFSTINDFKHGLLGLAAGAFWTLAGVDGAWVYGLHRGLAKIEKRWQFNQLAITEYFKPWYLYQEDRFAPRSLDSSE